ncbi:MAG: ABC transporter ATP-binding protein [gamma proteobacterium endosymbiont of Lamellibrachia anaximandri]|nr:ABC transporter ATP-binding protein [gamma proteobacterium endosymbiont of Lamellibrachia anaximandri]MBL3535198.1 ABC transporter ATP-binding protein [gamma proteobacterium endosymbiont of Lamellibrachia anaximandri]
MSEVEKQVPEEHALSLREVSRTFYSGGHKITALDKVDLTIPFGKVTGLIGPDGAGKTTLMRLAAGLLLPDAGRIQVLCIDAVANPLAVQSVVGYMPQRFGLYEDLTVQENLDFYADLHGVTEKSRPDRYRELLHMTGLGPFTSRLAGRLSGGMKQKLGLACTLVSPPRLLILDEPTAGVDPVSRRELWSIVDNLVKAEGMSVLLSTAYLDEAERCAEAILLHEGKIVAQGAPADFSETMRGRVFLASQETGNKRHLQSLLTFTPGVLDALIDGERIRLIMESPDTPVPQLDGSTIEPAPPRFEDAFIAALKGKPQAGRPLAPAIQHQSTSCAEDDLVITIENVARKFGDFYAVRDISFSVRRGEIFGLLGANGAGKSTTFRMLCGLLPVSAGRLSVAGHDLRHAAARARGRIGYMAQRFSLYSNLTVLQNLHFFASTYGLRNHHRQERIRWALDAFELAPYGQSNSGEMPLGFKQRLAFACALMHEPDILFLDEPTSGVDPLARREFWQRTNTLANAGVTVLITTHFMDEANYCDRLVIMADGGILTQGTPKEIKTPFCTPEAPEPNMEETFIALIEGREQTP